MKRWRKWLLLGTAVCLSPLALFMLLDFDTDEVIIAVLDTGVDAQHEWLQGRVMQGFDFADGDRTSSDSNGHGTHVAGIIAREAPDARLLSVRVIDERDDVKHSGWAILYSIARGADVVNMSFVEPENFMTKLAIRLGQMKGVVFVAASGNQGDAPVGFPARYDGVVSVAALDEDRRAVFGNVTGGVRYVAPGIDIASAGLGGKETTKTGTSMASAYVSGAYAYLKSAAPGMDANRLAASMEAYEHTIELSVSASVGTASTREDGAASKPASAESDPTGEATFRTIDIHGTHADR